MLAHVVRCLAEGASHIPYRDSKLTMMLNKGLGGGSLLHIILALSNSAEQAGSKPPVARRGGRVGRGQRAVSVGRLRLRQVNEGTACLRFGQSCLSMTVNPNANKLEKEQAEMRAVIKEQMQEISELQSENEELKRALEEAERAKESAVPDDFLIAKHIEVNKEALSEDLKEASEQIVKFHQYCLLLADKG